MWRERVSEIDQAEPTESSRERRRKRSSRQHGPLTVNLAPMIDMTFLLLIFFLVTTTFERAEGILASKVPSDGQASSVALPLSPILVRLSQTGPSHDDFFIHVEGIDESPASFEELSKVLKGLQSQPGFDHTTPVVILAGPDVLWDHIVGCWNAAVGAGCTKVAFGEK